MVAAAQQAMILGVDSADADQARAVRSDYATGRIAELQAKLAAREGRPGFERNSRMIRAEIAQLQKQEA